MYCYLPCNALYCAAAAAAAPQVLFSKECPLLDTGLTWDMRALYFGVTWSYITNTFAVPCSVLVPFIALVFGVYPLVLNRDFALAATLYYTSSTMVTMVGWVERLSLLKARGLGWFWSSVSMAGCWGVAVDTTPQFVQLVPVGVATAAAPEAKTCTICNCLGCSEPLQYKKCKNHKKACGWAMVHIGQAVAFWAARDNSTNAPPASCGNLLCIYVACCAVCAMRAVSAAAVRPQVGAHEACVVLHCVLPPAVVHIHQGNNQRAAHKGHRWVPRLFIAFL